MILNTCYNIQLRMYAKQKTMGSNPWSLYQNSAYEGTRTPISKSKNPVLKNLFTKTLNNNQSPFNKSSMTSLTLSHTLKDSLMCTSSPLDIPYPLNMRVIGISLNESPTV